MVFPQPKVPDFKKAMAPSSNFLMVVAVVTLIAIIVGGRVAFLCTVDSKQGREFRRQWKLQMKKMKVGEACGFAGGQGGGDALPPPPALLAVALPSPCRRLAVALPPPSINSHAARATSQHLRPADARLLLNTTSVASSLPHHP